VPRKAALQRHLDGDGPFLEIVEREVGEKPVWSEAISVYYAPPCVTEMPFHRSEHGIDPAPVCAVTSSA
jgi:hypothetical protein